MVFKSNDNEILDFTSNIRTSTESPNDNIIVDQLLQYIEYLIHDKHSLLNFCQKRAARLRESIESLTIENDTIATNSKRKHNKQPRKSNKTVSTQNQTVSTVNTVNTVGTVTRIDSDKKGKVFLETVFEEDNDFKQQQV